MDKNREWSIQNKTPLNAEIVITDPNGHTLEILFCKNYVGFRADKSCDYSELSEWCIEALHNKLGAWLAWQKRNY